MASLSERLRSNDLTYSELQGFFQGPEQEYLIDYLRNLQENVELIAQTVDNLNTLYVDNFTFSAYGQLYLASPPVANPDLGAGYQKITAFDTVAPVGTKNINVNLSNDSMSFEFPGVYAVNINGSISHNSSNQGRFTTVRFFNETQGTPAANVFPIGIGRNVTESSASSLILVDIDSTATGDDFIVQIGGGSTITNVSWNSLAWSIFSVGEYQGPDLVTRAVNNDL